MIARYATRKHSQSRALNRKSTHRRAPTIDKHPLPRLFLLSPRVRHAQIAVQALPNRNNRHTDSSSLLIRKAVRDLRANTLFHKAVLAEGSIFMLSQLGTVADTGNAVAFLVVFGDFVSDGDDGAAEVTADSGADVAEEVDVFPGKLMSSKFGGRWIECITYQSVGLIATYFTLTRTHSSRRAGTGAV